MRTFIETPTFTRKWVACGLTDDDLRTLENVLLIYLLDIYLKNEKIDLTKQEKMVLRKLVNVLKEE